MVVKAISYIAVLTGWLIAFIRPWPSTKRATLGNLDVSLTQNSPDFKAIGFDLMCLLLKVFCVFPMLNEL